MSVIYYYRTDVRFQKNTVVYYYRTLIREHMFEKKRRLYITIFPNTCSILKIENVSRETRTNVRFKI